MARALARGWAEPVLCTDAGSGRAERLAEELGGEAVAGNRELAERADLVILAHKPAQLAEVAAEAAGAAKVVVSLLARTPQAEVRACYPGTPVFRVEPNTPVEVGRGVVAFAEPDSPVDADLRERVRGRRARLLGAARRGAGRRRGAPRDAGRDGGDARGRDDGRGRRAAARPRRRHAGRPPRGRLPGRHDRPRTRRARARRRALGVPRGDGRRPELMEAREKIAEFLSALIWVYTLCIIAWIVVSFVFAFGVRMPYSRPLNAVLDFVRDVSEPYLRIFRRLGLRAGPLDFSPIIAILLLQIGGGLIVDLIDP